MRPDPSHSGVAHDEWRRARLKQVAASLKRLCRAAARVVPASAVQLSRRFTPSTLLFPPPTRHLRRREWPAGTAWRLKRSPCDSSATCTGRPDTQRDRTLASWPQEGRCNQTERLGRRRLGPGRLIRAPHTGRDSEITWSARQASTTARTVATRKTAKKPTPPSRPKDAITAPHRVRPSGMTRIRLGRRTESPFEQESRGHNSHLADFDPQPLWEEFDL